MFPCPKEIRGQKYIEWNRPRRKIATLFKETLLAAENEKPLQSFFEQYPVTLVIGALGGCHQPWVFPLPQFGTIEGLDSIPDFLICDWSSIGPTWTIVELESPKMRPTNSRGISGDCHHAIEQIQDYKRYFKENVEGLQRFGWTGLNGDCKGFVVIGTRRHERSQKDSSRLADFRQQQIEIASYDRLLEKYEYFQSWTNRQWRIARSMGRETRPKKKAGSGRAGR
jgi:hypothetical protein